MALAALAWHFNTPPRHLAFKAMPETLRTIAAAAVVFGIAGFGLIRLLLPEPLRRYELLWVLPTGACAVGLALTVLCFAAVPYPVALGLTLAAGIGLGYRAVGRRGWPRVELPRLGWPLYLAFVALAVALVPLLLIQHFAAPVGFGSDAHVATGVAQFLQHDYPTSVDLHQPLNQMQPTWQSKYPIYYAFAAVSSISGLATWQVLSILAAFMLALTSLGMFLLARDVFRAPVAVAIVAMFAATLDRVALATIGTRIQPDVGLLRDALHADPGMVGGPAGAVPARPARRTVGLLALFALVVVLAYPLAAPIPAVPLIVFAVTGWRRRRKAGEPVLSAPISTADAAACCGSCRWWCSWRCRWPGRWTRRSRLSGPWLPAALAGGWAGDLSGYVPWGYFFSLPNSPVGTVLFVAVLVLASLGWPGSPGR